jgi:hypothetical protein
MPIRYNRRAELLQSLNNSGHFESEIQMYQALCPAAVKILTAELAAVVSGDLMNAFDVVEYHGKYKELRDTGAVN